MTQGTSRGALLYWVLAPGMKLVSRWSMDARLGHEQFVAIYPYCPAETMPALNDGLAFVDQSPGTKLGGMETGTWY